MQGLPAEVRTAPLTFGTTRLNVISQPATNQSPPFEGRNLYSGDRVLQAAVAVGQFSCHDWAGDIDVPVAVVATTLDRIVPLSRQVRLVFEDWRR